MEVDGNYGVTVINLTQTGAGNEPTADLSARTSSPPYFADTKNVPMTGPVSGEGEEFV